MRKETAIKKIEELPDKYLNHDEKIMAKRFIDSANEHEVQDYLDFIMTRRHLGFHFDYAPELAQGEVAVINNDKKLNIGSDLLKANSLIIGDNFEALKNLLVIYREKIDVIYIDPPYNTESASDDGNNSSYKENVDNEKLIYRDKYGRTGWLNMMKQRLDLAYDLLSDTGLIFISIDDNEQAYLKVLCDEIFGEENFVENITVTAAPAGKQSSNYFATQQQYCLIYRKSENAQITGRRLEKDEITSKFSEADDRGNYYFERLWKRGQGGLKEDVPSLFFPVWYNPKTNQIVIDDDIDKVDDRDSYEKIIPYKTKGVLGRWTWSKQKMRKDHEELLVRKVSGEWKLFKKVYAEEENLFVKPYSIIDSELGRTELGSLELKSIMGKDTFTYPKYSKFVEFLISMHPNKNALVLDFFAGSGTTGQAVMQANKNDGGNRKFILCTNDENSIGHNITYERLYRIINGAGTDGQSFPWTEKNQIFKDESLLVFDIKHFNVSNNGLSQIDEARKTAVDNFKLLDSKYNDNELNVYYDLSGLNPYDGADKDESN